MKRSNITFGTILVVLGCLAFSPAAKASPPIVGLWQVEYTGSCQLPVLPPDFFTYQQFHSDGLEFESANLFPGAHCMGTWKQMANMVQIYHVGWTPGGIPGVPTSVRFVFTEILTVSGDHIVTMVPLIKRFTTRLSAEMPWGIAPLQPMRRAFL
jgi:hypothetical protein